MSPAPFLMDVSPEELDGILDLVGGYDLEYASVNVNGDFIVRQDVENEIATACRDIGRAERLAAKVVILFAGWVDRDDDAVYDQVSAALKRVARHAAEHGLPVALENHGGLTTTAEQCNRLVSAAGEPNLGINYDPANFLMHDEDPLRALEMLDVPIRFTRLKSVKRVDGRKEYCRLSEGEIDYLPILQKLRKTYDGICALEYEEPSDVLEGTADDMETLKGWLDEIR